MAMQLHTVKFRAMGSPCSIRLYASDREAAHHSAQPAIDEVNRLEQAYSRYREDSLLSSINQSAGRQAIAVDDETAAILDYAIQAWQQSGGLFDITSGVLRKVWDFRAQKIPEQGEIAEILPLIGLQKVEWNRPYVRLPEQGMELDFGGCVKEYAADAAATVLRSHGVGHAVVELGGDIAVIGARDDGSPWPLGIRHPHNPSSVVTRIGLSEGALASSGDYERYTLVNGQRYCHILNPLTGWPVAPPASVSIIGPNCLVAGTVCTIAMLQGEANCVTWLESVALPFCVVKQDASVVNCF